MEEVVLDSKEKRGSCLACGVSPVHHRVAYVTQTFDAWMSDLLSQSGGGRSFFGIMNRIRPKIEAVAVMAPRIAYYLGASSFRNDPSQASSYRSQVIWEEAMRRGIVMEQMLLFGAATEIYRAHINGRSVYFKSLPVPPGLEQDIYNGIDDKLNLKQFLHERGHSVPRASCVTTIADAIRAFQDMGGPVIVKPRIGTRARHTITNIHNPEDLRKAFLIAQQLCKYVLIEEHMYGGVCRATVVAGRLVGFFESLPGRVTGDGAHTIRELIEIKNATRHPRVSELVIDSEHMSYLQRSGYTLDSVIEYGATIDLSRRIGRLEGGETREMPESVHPKLRAYVEKAARELRAPVVGFDLIIPDSEADPDTQRWGILEANSLPFIDLHYLPLHGKPTNVAAAVWDLWKDESVAESAFPLVETPA